MSTAAAEALLQEIAGGFRAYLECSSATKANVERLPGQSPIRWKITY